MNALIFSDMHFYNNPSKSYVDDKGWYSWLHNQLILCSYIFEQAKEMGVTTVIHNGDLCKNKHSFYRRLGWYYYHAILQPKNL